MEHRNVKAAKSVVSCLWVAGVIVTSPFVANAVSYTWQGGSSGVWNNAGNWSPNGIPGGGDVAVFSGSAEITDGITIDNGLLTISRGGVVRLDGAIVDGTHGSGALACTGDGAVHLSGTNTFSGGFSATGVEPGTGANNGSGSVYIHNGSALGAGIATLVSKTGPRLYVDGGLTVTTEIYFDAHAHYNDNGYIDMKQGSSTSVTFNEKITSLGKLYLYGAANTAYYFKKPVSCGQYMFGTGKLHFESTLSSPTLWMTAGASSEIHYYVAGNTAGAYYFYSNNTYCYGDNVLPATVSKLSFGAASAVCHLMGHNQRQASSVSTFALDQPATCTHGFESPVGSPAIYTLAPPAGKTFSWHGLFLGAAGFCWDPAAGTSTFIFSNTVQNTVGDLHVSNGVVRVAYRAGFTQLANLVIADGATFAVDEDAWGVYADALESDTGATIMIGGVQQVVCHSARIGGQQIAEGTYDETSGYFTGTGKLVVSTTAAPNVWNGGSTGFWNQPTNWSRGTVPAAGERVLIGGAGTAVSVMLSETTPRLADFSLGAGATLSFNGTNVSLNAGLVQIDGTVTAVGPFTNEEARTRVWISCDDLEVNRWGSIDVSAKGWAAGFGPGTPRLNQSGYGASHGGVGGAFISVSGSWFAPGVYGDANAPTEPGSGGYAGGTAGGGAVCIEATDLVRVDGAIRASAGSITPTLTLVNQSCGAGGSVWISCAKFTGSGGSVLADGGSSDFGGGPDFITYYAQGRSISKSQAGGGGRIRITYGAAQASETPNVLVSAAAGGYKGFSDGTGRLTAATHDKYFADADLGTVTFTDDVLVRQLLGWRLSGRLVGVSSYFHTGDLSWTNGHVRFAGTGAVVRITGNLVLSGADSRLEIGGVLTRTNVTVVVDRWGGRALNRLTVGGDLEVLDGAALDIRAAETNATMAWGGEIAVDGDFTVGTGAHFRPWCDILNLGAPHVTVGGAFTVAAGGEVSADRRGGAPGHQTGTWAPRLGNRTAGYGYGAGISAGASHGGSGGKGYQSNSDTSSGTPPSLVDDEWTAAYPGAGGFGGGYGEGGIGGGLVYVEALGAVTVDGTISADGAFGTYSWLGLATANTPYCTYFASGAGGGIHLKGASFGGNGRISARGGNSIAGYADAGNVYGYASGTGGGGRVAVIVGADDEATHEEVSSYRATSAQDERIAQRVTFAGIVDVGAGSNVWSVASKTTPPVQFVKSYGGVGTVRYVRLQPPRGTVIMFK